jgi:hypothetical protein
MRRTVNTWLVVPTPFAWQSTDATDAWSMTPALRRRSVNQAGVSSSEHRAIGAMARIE